MTELPTRYAPHDVETAIYRRWIEARAFHAEPSAGGEPYCIVIPPPNVTAALHLGHALNNTLQDVLVRWRRMQGRNTLWMPGTDHAGIATQTVVEKRVLAERGQRRTDFERDEFVGMIQAWKDEYEARILGQLKSMGCSCDWENTRFTMDDVCARAVRENFFRLFSDGLIYRGKRLVNWDPATQTVLADDEVEHETVQGHFWYLRYPLTQPVEAGGETLRHVTVATTRPETMLGDTAVAMNPADPRAAALVGRAVRVPIVGREIPIVADDHVVLPNPESADEKAAFSTGFLKVTPAHDLNDWQIGQRHGLPVINVMAPDGSISERHGWTDWEAIKNPDVENVLGMDRFEARQAIVEWLRRNGLLESMRDYTHDVGHSYRSHVPIEPYLSDQWYIAVKKPIASLPEPMKRAGMSQADAGRLLTERGGVEYIGDTDVPVNSLAGLALAPLMDGRLKFTPERYARTYQTWLENLRDWPISRQLWWGHQIPVWSKPGSDAAPPTEGVAVRETVDDTGNSTTYVCAKSDDKRLLDALERGGFVRDPDVLDTWFSSALWPFSTLGWPEPTLELKTYYPGHVLCTAREIITLWVSRMVMMGQYCVGDIPFRDVFIHAMLQDGEGRKMSKSLGNGIDPLDIIESHGADAMRFTLCDMTTQTQDVRMPVEPMTLPDGRRINSSPKFDQGRNFCNKLWNAARFVMGAIADEPAAFDLREADLQFADRWILVRAARTADEVTRLLGAMDFNPAVTAIYDFIWRDFCDWYLELAKPRLREGGRSAATAQRVLGFVLDVSLRLLHPVAPFVTEALWEPLSELLGRRAGDTLLAREASALLVKAAWPEGLAGRFEPLAQVGGADVVETTERLQGIVRAIRNARSRMNIPPRQGLDVVIAGAGAWRGVLDANRQFVTEMAGVSSFELPEGDPAPGNAALEVFGAMKVYVKLDPGMLAAERDRLDKKISAAEQNLAASDKKLANENFVARAKPEVIQRERDLNAKLRTEIEGLRANLEGLG